MSDFIPEEPSVMASGLLDYIYGFFGQAGCGKTYFVRKVFGSKRTLFVSTDRGTRDLSARRVEVHDWKTVRKVFKSLERNLGSVEVLCFDHVDDLITMIETYTCEYYSSRSKGDVYETIGEVPHGKGWVMLRTEIQSLVHRTLNLGVTPVFIAHEDIKEIKTGGLEIFKTMPSMSNQAKKYILPIVNVFGQITFKKMKVEGGKRKDVRILVTQPRADLYVKDRSIRRKPEKGYEILDAQAFRESFETSGVKGRRAK